MNTVDMIVVIVCAILGGIMGPWRYMYIKKIWK